MYVYHEILKSGENCACAVDEDISVTPFCVLKYYILLQPERDCSLTLLARKVLSVYIHGHSGESIDGLLVQASKKQHK